MNNNPMLNQMNQATKNEKDAKTVAEYESIIRRYRKTGCLDRQDALNKYRQFNCEHPDYFTMMNTVAVAHNNSANLETVQDSVIVSNLNAQVMYLCGKNLLDEGHNNG